MIAVVSRVTEGVLKVDGNIISEIGRGLIAYIGVEKDDDINDVRKMSYKLINERIFEDENGKMNLSVKDKNYEILAVSNFTVTSDTKKGLRPDFYNAAKPDDAVKLYDEVCRLTESEGLIVKKGIFGADMKISSVADGPVNIIISTK